MIENKLFGLPVYRLIFTNKRCYFRLPDAQKHAIKYNHAPFYLSSAPYTMKPIRQLILDTETTGLYPNTGDRMIEFAALEMIDRHLTGKQLHFYINPERSIPEEATRIHGITDEQVQDKPLFAQVGQEIIDYLRDAQLIIHNAPFDVGFLNMEFTRIGLPKVETITADIIDTLAMAKKAYPGQKNSLDALCTRFEIDRSSRVFHGAVIDCALLADVYLYMTRRQFSLDMDGQDKEIDNSGSLKISPLHTGALKVRTASAQELCEHENYLQNLAKENPESVLYYMPTKDES